ncbi:hypothetical protein [Neisseria sp. 83E34]|uniref:hypothetical protein n=1 Tax=Neisseria sp. 83E34 TaxID=1692264 RepID=UPI0006CEAA43|nr:hypothetical protein [Neisseria sp. 83E34]KPN71800.1 hypothetical protein AKG09_05880 [Neisseria sp. 83E34]
MKYIFTSILSILATVLFFNFVSAAPKNFTADILSSNKEAAVDERGIYLDSHLNYKNWQVAVSETLEQYKTGSNLLITNSQNPFAMLVKDNDAGHIEGVLISDKDKKGQILCNTNRVWVGFDGDVVDEVVIYDGVPSTKKPTYEVTLKKQNGKWEFVERTIAECI